MKDNHDAIPLPAAKRRGNTGAEGADQQSKERPLASSIASVEIVGTVVDTQAVVNELRSSYESR